MQPMTLQVGDVVQIKPQLNGSAFPGCFMLVTEPKSWGAQGYIAMPKSRSEIPGRAYYRCGWEEMEFVGRASWVPADDVPKTEEDTP